MAASDPDPRSQPPSSGRFVCLSAPALQERIEEEISRAERQGTALSCLLVVIDNIEELTREHGSDLLEQTLSYVSSALRRELRRFDRIGRPSDRELLVVLPGADGPRAEIVARRLLERTRAIKLEAEGKRRPLRISVGIAAWRAEISGADLLAQTRAAAQRGAENGSPAVATATPLAAGSPPALGRPRPS